MSIRYARVTVDMAGIVQGVGFRPSLQLLAEEAGLSGWIQNRSGVVRMALEGPAHEITAFLNKLPTRIPPRARLDRVDRLVTDPLDEGPGQWHFEIRDSEADPHARVSIPADLGVCSDCASEVFDPESRFFGYPFTTCTNCGPRYTVVHGMPYDRDTTTLDAFPLCQACRVDYTNVRDRRFHAESIACPVCGPTLRLTDPSGKQLASGQAAIPAVRAALARGDVVAVRGVGGFQLACDAFNRSSLMTLRERKHRPKKPFAVMLADRATAGDLCQLDDETVSLLESPERPIVIVDTRPEAVARLGLPLELLTPDSTSLGVMLPTTPLHLLLLRPLQGDATPVFSALVMTSGNHGGEPICITNEQAYERLQGIAALFLVHDREINLRCDDSVAIMQQGRPQLWRRARGYVPERLVVPRALSRPVLAMGAELKNTIALGEEDEVILSPHVGDLATPGANDALLDVVESFPRYFEIQPAVVAVDQHPDMQCTRLGRRLAKERGLEVVAVQHHHAHAVAALAEHGLGSGLAVVFDGTGLGPDGSIWGAEVLSCRGAEYERLATFMPAPLLGGDAAVREPARQVVARWCVCGMETPAWFLERYGITGEQLAVWRRQCERGINAPHTHAAGRLFDAAAAVIGIAPKRIDYEGQAAIRLEAAALRAAASGWQSGSVWDAVWLFSTLERDGLCQIDWSPAFDLLGGPQLPEGRRDELALAFHRQVAAAAVAMVEYGVQRTGQRQVCLTGGVFMNRILTRLIIERLSALGLRVYCHERIPPNDGGIALGQAVIAGGGL